MINSQDPVQILADYLAKRLDRYTVAAVASEIRRLVTVVSIDMDINMSVMDQLQGPPMYATMTLHIPMSYDSNPNSFVGTPACSDAAVVENKTPRHIVTRWTTINMAASLEDLE